MANEIIINATLQETRVALLEEGVLAELYVEGPKTEASWETSIRGRW